MFIKRSCDILLFGIFATKAAIAVAGENYFSCANVTSIGSNCRFTLDTLPNSEAVFDYGADFPIRDLNAIHTVTADFQCGRSRGFLHIYASADGGSTWAGPIYFNQKTELVLKGKGPLKFVDRRLDITSSMRVPIPCELNISSKYVIDPDSETRVKAQKSAWQVEKATLEDEIQNYKTSLDGFSNLLLYAGAFDAIKAVVDVMANDLSKDRNTLCSLMPGGKYYLAINNVVTTKNTAIDAETKLALMKLLLQLTSFSANGNCKEISGSVVLAEYLSDEDKGKLQKVADLNLSSQDIEAKILEFGNLVKLKEEQLLRLYYISKNHIKWDKVPSAQ